MVEASTVPPFLTARDTAEHLTRLARAFEQCFAMFGTPCPELPVASRVAWARASRVFGEHAQECAALVPESVLLAEARAAGSASPLPLPAEPADAVRALDAALAAVVERAAVVADGALLRLGARLRPELAELARDLGEAARRG